MNGEYVQVSDFGTTSKLPGESELETGHNMQLNGHTLQLQFTILKNNSWF